MKRFLFFSVAAAIACGACSSKSSPAQPSDSSAPVDTNASASVTTPRLLTPAVNQVIPNAQQPVTLVVGNAAVTSGSASYTFEVATDSAFANTVATKSGVSPTSGQTAVTLDPLAAGTDYYWRARAVAGTTSGPFTAPRKFTIGPAIQVDPPTPIAPSNGATTQGWPALSVRNSTRTGNAGAIVYRFEVATSNTFANILVSATIAEQGTNTTYVIPSSTPAPTPAVVFWRVTAIDASNNVSSPVSSISQFTYTSPTQQAILATQQGQVLWPNAQPTGSNGHAQMGPGWNLGTLRSFNGVTFQSPPIEVLRIFDLLDRGYDPDSAISWMQSNGYSTTAVWYPSVAAMGFPYQYLALIQGAWELVLRVGA